jgi:hypothetical protein
LSMTPLGGFEEAMARGVAGTCDGGVELELEPPPQDWRDMATVAMRR